MMSDYHKITRIKRLAKLIHFGNEDPAAKATMDMDTWKPHNTGTRRVGQPRINWLAETMQDMWKIARKNTTEQYMDLKVENVTHKAIMTELAKTITEKKIVTL